MARLIVDSRESRSGLAQLLAQRGADVVVEELDVGDYVLADGLAVERKAASDFILSIENRRVFAQLATLKATYARAFIVVEGNLFATRSSMAEDALLGAMSYITVLEGVPILTTGTTAQTATLLLTMQRHALEGLGYEIALCAGKPRDRLAQSQYLVEGLPGVGPTAARNLLSHFGSAHSVFTAQAEELRQVAGVGPKTVTTVREVLEFDTRGVSIPKPPAT
ncbi:MULTISPECIES: ERCC4 domain-containing protein [unclassified Variovorax]|uniref:ERCC4 domain-containing protein n=1 Tax=unclassified Variovorax TaxID=663243 RepID=UPI0013186539|nr:MULTISPECIES: ERCC4 domain-containing protein [unclassified Variovorax]VTU41952.1 Hef nuclease [Variovorax sp. SRS16]VTU41985.1 Hef nuclease [Variovorax sp. PBL-E5]VTU44484.1 Hef nuclease [Variovorax sp. PBL-H6]